MQKRIGNDQEGNQKIRFHERCNDPGITGKYNFYEFFFSKIFSERQETIKKDFEIIDEGMKRNDKELISAGLAGLSQVVASSPFTDMEKLRRMLDTK